MMTHSKVYRLIDIMDVEVVDKLVYLDRLVRLYSKFLKMWKVAGVTSDGKEVRIKFLAPINGHQSFTERVFPIEDIDGGIERYRKKVAYEFKMRHENPRIQRDKEITKWKRYIEEAKLLT